jgi:hypothetical protein
VSLLFSQCDQKNIFIGCPLLIKYIKDENKCVWLEWWQISSSDTASIDAIHNYHWPDGVSCCIWRPPLNHGHGFSHYLTPLTKTTYDESRVLDYNTINHLSSYLTEHKNTTTYDIGNPGLGQGHTCGGVKPVNENAIHM